MDGTIDRYLFVKPFTLNWCIWPSLKAKRDYIMSGSSGHPCPAHPRNKINNGYNLKDWAFNKAGEDSEPDREEGGTEVHCSVHNVIV